MSERWRERVRKAWQELHAAAEAQERVDDNAAEERNERASENFWRAVTGRPPVSAEAFEARRRFEEDTADHDAELRAGDPVALERNERLMAAATDAECAAGIHRFCAHRGDGPDNEPVHDDDEYMSSMGYAAEPVGVVWGTVNPDGSVTGRGFRDDESYSDDKAVHPVRSLVAYHPEDNTWVHMATGQTVAKQRELDAKRAERARAKTASSSASGAGAGTTSGGSGVSHASEGNAQIQQAGQDIEAAMGAIQEIVNQLTQAEQNLMLAADESQHSEADAARGALQQAISAANDLLQQVGAAQQAVEEVRL